MKTNQLQQDAKEFALKESVELAERAKDIRDAGVRLYRHDIKEAAPSRYAEASEVEADNFRAVRAEESRWNQNNY